MEWSSVQNSPGREGVSSLFSHVVFTETEAKDVSTSGRACCQSRRTERNIISLTWETVFLMTDADVSDLINIRGSLQTHRAEYGIVWVTSMLCTNNSAFVHLTVMEIINLHRCITKNSVTHETDSTGQTDRKISEGSSYKSQLFRSFPVVPLCCIKSVWLILCHWLRRTFKGRASFNWAQNKAPSTLSPLAPLTEWEGIN